MKLKLHKPHGKNKYCGPSALSAITGFSTDECAAVVRSVVPHVTTVKLMYDNWFMRAIKAMGGEAAYGRQFGIRRITFRQWMDSRSEDERQKLMVVTVTGHYVTVLRDLTVDNKSGKELVHFASSRNAGKLYKSAMVITPPTKWVLPAAVQRMKVEKSEKAGARGRALKLAKSLGMTVDREGTWGYYLNGPDDMLSHLGEGNRLSGRDWDDVEQALIELRGEALEWIKANGQKQAA